MRQVEKLCMSLVLASLLAGPAWSMGTEELGNKPLSGANYKAWPGVIDVINDSHRVYQRWVNGNEMFFFQGDTEALNQALENLAKVKTDKVEVVLRVGPGQTTNFSGNKKIDFGWRLHLIGGIAAAMRREDQGELIWARHPVLSIYVGEKISLDTLKIPAKITVSHIGQLQQRYAKAMNESESKMVRGWACGEIAALDPFNSAAMYRIAKMLTDEDPWVRLNAASAIARYGAKAKPALKALRAAAEGDDEKLSKQAKASIEKIKAAKPDAEAEARHVDVVKAITRFCDQRATDDPSP